MDTSTPDLTFNMFHDLIAERKFEALQKQFGFHVCIETGTHEGHGSLNASRYCNTVITCEINESFQDKAIIRWLRNGYSLSIKDNAVLAINKGHLIVSYLESSHLLLPKILKSYEDKPICFYLDAHWGHYFPLPDELNIIAEWAGKDKCIIIIHDCLVPGKGFAYDSYNGKPISYETFKDHLSRINPNFKISYNESSEQKEPGHPVDVGIMYCTP